MEKEKEKKTLEPKRIRYADSHDYNNNMEESKKIYIDPDYYSFLEDVFLKNIAPIVIKQWSIDIDGKVNITYIDDNKMTKKDRNLIKRLTKILF